MTALLNGEDNSVLAAIIDQVAELAARGRYESAARLRDQAGVAVETLWRCQRLRALAQVEQLVAAEPDGQGGWNLVIVRHGQLAAAGSAPRGVPPMPVVDALLRAAQCVIPQPAPLGGALVEETALIARWLATPGIRLVSATTGLTTPLRSAGPWVKWAALVRSARLAADQAASQLLGEPHPSREQLLGRPGVDGFGGPPQTVFPRRQPFGATG
jgi:DNA polymerase-3 subunit epsilon